MKIIYQDKPITLPNFLIVGAAKSGTTAISSWLNKHPEVYIPEIKECRFFSEVTVDYQGPGDEFFNRKKIRSIEEYSKLFAKKEETQVKIDASVDYLYYYENTIRNINKYYPNTNLPGILVFIRNPIKRAFSMYNHLRMLGRETLSFHEAIKVIDERKKRNYEWSWDYLTGSEYSDALISLKKNFPKVKIVIFEELISNQNNVLHSILEFLSLNNTEFNEPLNRENKTGTINSSIAKKLINKNTGFVSIIKKHTPKSWKSKLRNAVIDDTKKPKLSNDTYSELKDYFKNDVAKTSEILNKDLFEIWEMDKHL